MDFGLDAKLGADLCQVEKYGDWYRDPWSWPELNWVIGKPQNFPWDEILLRNGPEVGFRNKLHFDPIVVPKSPLGIRPAVVMTLDAKIAYHAASQRLLVKMHRDLPEWVFGWRARASGGDFNISNNSQEWLGYSQFYDNYSGSCDFALQTDLTSFFGSINAERMAGLIFDIDGRSAPGQVLTSVILEHDQLQTRSGLPQRSWSSAFLAHLYVRAIDDMIDGRLQRGVIDAAVRWMDDIHLIGKEEVLYRLFIELQDRCREMNLETNAAKSHLGPVGELREQFYIDGFKKLRLPARTAPMSFSSGGGFIETESAEEDLGTLKDLEDNILSNLALAKSNVIKRLLIELRQRKVFNNFSIWLAQAHKMPHLADALSRYFREAIKLEDPKSCERRSQYIEWLCRFRLSDWAAIPWVTAQYALAVSSLSCNEDTIADMLREWLTNSSDLQQVSLAVQRLSICDPGCVRDIVRRRIDTEARPLMQRSLAFGLLAAGDERAIVQRLIMQDSRNVVTYRFLESTHYGRPKVPADFDSAMVRGVDDR